MRGASEIPVKRNKIESKRLVVKVFTGGRRFVCGTVQKGKARALGGDQATGRPRGSSQPLQSHFVKKTSNGKSASSTDVFRRGGEKKDTGRRTKKVLGEIERTGSELNDHLKTTCVARLLSRAGREKTQVAEKKEKKKGTRGGSVVPVFGGLKG